MEITFTFMGFTSSDKHHYRYNTNSQLGNKHLGSVFYYKKYTLPFIMQSSSTVSLLPLHISKCIIPLMFHLLTIQKLFMN